MIDQWDEAAIAVEPVINTEPPKPVDQKPASRSGTWPVSTQKEFLIIADEHDRPSLYKPDGEENKLVSGGIWINGLARDSESTGWCLVIDFVDMDNNKRQWLMARNKLSGSRQDLLKDLYDRGLFIADDKKLAQYIRYGRNDKYRTVDRTGWHDGCFVLPDQVIGDKKILLNNARPPIINKSGTLKSWRDNVAAACAGNSRLAFGISSGFASPMLELVGADGGGFHIVGVTSLGKTKVLKASTTVFGAKMLSWNTTANALESTAETHSHIGLSLDEIGEMDPSQVGKAVYMLANGNGKTRARQDGTAKPPSTHKLIVLTNGEKSLGEHMASVGRKTMAGQEIRLINIEADAGRGYGIFDTIHESPDSSHFADSFDLMTQEHTGHAGPEFVRYIIENREECKVDIRDLSDIFFEANGVSDEVGQVQRVAKRFALVAAAGEIATKIGITGWEEHEALRSAGILYKQWRSNWTVSGGREHEEAIELVRGFLQVHKARFIRDSFVPQNCVGYARDSEFWIFPKVFSSEVCSDIRLSTVTQALLDAGFLVPEKNSKKRLARRTPPGEGQQRFRVIRDSILSDDDNV